MTAKIISGKDVAQQIREELKKEVDEMIKGQENELMHFKTNLMVQFQELVGKVEELQSEIV